MGEAEDTQDSYKDLDGKAHNNSNPTLTIPQNTRYKSQGQGTSNMVSNQGGLLRMQKQILGNLSNATYNDVQLQKGLAKSNGGRIALLQSQDRLRDDNGNLLHHQSGIFIYGANESRGSRRQYSSGYILAPGR